MQFRMHLANLTFWFLLNALILFYMNPNSRWQSSTSPQACEANRCPISIHWHAAEKDDKHPINCRLARFWSKERRKRNFLHLRKTYILKQFWNAGNWWETTTFSFGLRILFVTKLWCCKVFLKKKTHTNVTFNQHRCISTKNEIFPRTLHVFQISPTHFWRRLAEEFDSFKTLRVGWLTGQLFTLFDWSVIVSMHPIKIYKPGIEVQVSNNGFLVCGSDRARNADFFPRNK